MSHYLRIKGEDAEGKTHWLSQNGFWTDLVGAGIFTAIEADNQIRKINARNLYQAASDKIQATAERAR